MTAYALRVFFHGGNIEEQVIGVPDFSVWGIPVVISRDRHRYNMIGLWFRAKWRSLARKPLMFFGDIHEERFRHFHRKAWVDEPQPAPCHDKVTHGHPILAAERRGVHLGAVGLLKRRDYRPYDISSSRRTLRSKTLTGQPLPGYHGLFSPRDFMYPSRNDLIGPRDAITLIDVDYYLDMNELASQMVPMILYTFNPHTLSGHTPESSWNIVADGAGLLNVTYSVSGGEDYKHLLWDYGSASYVVFDHAGMHFSYAIERHRPNNNSTHQVIWLQPNTISVADCPKFKRVFQGAHHVTRKRAPSPIVQNGDSLLITDGNLEFRLRARLWQTICLSAEGAKTVSASQTYTFLKNHSEDWIEGDLQYFSEWISSRFKKQTLPSTVVYASLMEKPDGGYFSTNMKTTHYEMEPRPSTAPAATPTNDRCSDAAAVTTRISQVHNSKPLPPKFDDYLKEFLELIGERTNVQRNSLKPYTMDEILARTERAKTAEKIAAAVDTALSSATSKTVKVKAFVKKEVYVKPGDERNISPTDDNHLSKLAPYAYRFKDVLCSLDQYMPGRTPRKIAGTIAGLIKSGSRLWETDFSRYDGQQSRCMRTWETVCFGWFFEDREAAELVYKEIFNVEATTGSGTYEPGGSLLSGSSLTTIMNTFKHMLIQYITYRECGYSPQAAFTVPYLAYGDDGVLVGDDKVSSTMARVCDEIGMKNLKCVEACTPDRPYLTFVGRVFLPSDNDETSSFQDPGRVWTKINLISKGANAQERYAAKLGCYLVTDGNSPLLGAYCRKVLGLSEVGRNVLKSLKKLETEDGTVCDLADAQIDRQWLLVESRAKVSEAWPNDDFPPNVRAVYASLLGLSVQELDDTTALVREAKTLADLNGVLRLPDPVLHPRFVYDGIALSYGQALRYDDNKVTGRITKSEHKSIARTTKAVLGSDTRVPVPKCPNRDNRAKATSNGPRGPAPTGSGATQNVNTNVKWVRTPKSAQVNADSSGSRTEETATPEKKGGRPTPKSSRT
jgi:hypothetical protein